MRTIDPNNPNIETQFYRRVAAINNVRYLPPQSAQENYTALRNALQRLRPTRNADGATMVEYQALEEEYNRLFDLVSFDFPDPERQRAEDLGLEG